MINWNAACNPINPALGCIDAPPQVGCERLGNNCQNHYLGGDLATMDKDKYLVHVVLGAYVMDSKIDGIDPDSLITHINDIPLDNPKAILDNLTKVKKGDVLTVRNGEDITTVKVVNGD